MTTTLRSARRPALIWMCVSCLSGCGGADAASSPASPQIGFAVARSARTRGDVLPRLALAALVAGERPRFAGADLRLARRVTRAGWLVPDEKREVCLVQLVEPLIRRENGVPLAPAVSMRCLPEPAAREGRLIEARALAVRPVPSPRYQVVGVMPDGVSHVELLLGPRGHETVTVTRNAYEAVVRAPRAVRYVTSGGTAAHSIPILRPRP